MLECVSRFQIMMKDMCQVFRTRVAKTIKERQPQSSPHQKSRVQVNASFSKAEYGVLGRAAKAKGIAPARLLKHLALQNLGKAPGAIEAELQSLSASAQETSQLLRLLYRDSSAWQKLQLSQIRPLLKRLAEFESKASRIINHLATGNAD